ncbi:MAG: protein kinase [Phycisphaerae bacterium]|nr:protein kinase [Phycisphaerae bacterium]
MSGDRKDNTHHSTGDTQGPTRDMPGPRLAPGVRIGHFEIEQVIGQGGMGIVYLARDITLGRPVAVKCLPPELLADRTIRSRLEREARLLALLSHPNIAAIYERIEETEGTTYLILEYVPGPSLADRIAGGSLRLEEALSVACQTAGALAAAHEHGIIHRDLKPGNIKITPEGDVKVLDFGLAKAIQETKSQGQHSTITEPGRVMGTPAYMSPEQTAGDPVDHRTDIWSLGVVVYEMLTGTLPFEGVTQQALTHSILHGEPKRLTHLRRDAPMELERMLTRMMQKDHLKRPESMKTVVEELQAMRRDTITDASTSNRPPSIAVLPFVNMSADPDQEYFCDGMAEEVINALTQIPDLRVIARTSAFFYKGKDVTIREIGRELEVATILEGSVRKAGNRLRITAQLIDTTGGHHLWSERYDRNLDDVFAIQDEITLAIVDQLKPKLLGDVKARVVERQAVEPEVYDLYLRGCHFRADFKPEAVPKAIQYFQQAIERDPTYAPACAELAVMYCQAPMFGQMLPAEAIPRAKEMALKAVQIGEGLPEPHTALGFFKTQFEWDWTKAQQCFERAIELNPGYAMAHRLYAVHLLYRGRTDEAMAEIERSLHLDPLSVIANRQSVCVYCFASQYDRALEAARRTLELDASAPFIHLFIGMAYAARSMYEEALAELEKEKEIAKGRYAWPEAWSAYVHASAGQPERAREECDRLLARAKQRYVSPYLLACAHWLTGQDAEGFEWADRAFEEHDPWLCFIRYGPLENLRSDPRYRALLRKMNLES